MKHDRRRGRDADPDHRAAVTRRRAFDVREAPASRWRQVPVVGGVLLAHLGAMWALLQVDSVRAAAREAAPLFVDFIAAASPPAPELPPPPPPPPELAPPPPKPKPVIAAKPKPATAPPVFEAPPPPPPEPAPAPPAVVVVEAPPPAPPAPAAAPQPKTVDVTAVRYLEPPAPVYPSISRRSGEAGRVVVRVLIDSTGKPRQLALQQPSGYTRLDDSALSAVRAARFQPYTEGGVAQPVWVLIPIVFALE